MITPTMIAAGKFLPQDIKITVSPSNRKIDMNIEKQLEGLWQTKVKIAEEKGKRIYNGLSYRLNSFHEENGQLNLDLGVFDFKTRECLLETDGYFSLNEEYYRKGCHTSATIKTNDDQYLLVELSGRSMNVNAVDFLGGIIETNVEMRTGSDLFQSLYLELAEEGCIQISDIKEAYLTLIYLNANTNICFHFEIKLSISSSDLLKRFAQTRADDDIKALKVCSRTEYIDTLIHHNTNKQFVAARVGI